MDRRCEGMDKICIWLEKLLLWVDRCGPPPIMWVGRAGGRFDNPPAPHLEFVFVLEGKCPSLFVGDRKVSLQEGDVSLHSVHFGNKSPPNERFAVWCLFLDVGGEKEFESLCATPLSCVMRAESKEELKAAFANLAARCYRYGSGPGKGYLDPRPLFKKGSIPSHVSSVMVKNALLDLLVILLEDARQNDGGKSADEYPAPVLKAMEFMSGRVNTAASASLPHVAKAAGLSVDHFGRLFKRYAGMTPMKWLQELRIRQSRFLLERTALLVEEIAAEVGFQDPFHFSRVFKESVGESPTAYRRKRSNETGKAG